MLVQGGAQEAGPLAISLVQCSACSLYCITWNHFSGILNEPVTLLSRVEVDWADGGMVPRHYGSWYEVAALGGAGFEGCVPCLTKLALFLGLQEDCSPTNITVL